jgi:hypothetical protein
MRAAYRILFGRPFELMINKSVAQDRDRWFSSGSSSINDEKFFDQLYDC